VLGAEQFSPDTEDLVREVRESNRTLKVVVLAATQHEDEIVRALSAGVSGFLSQDISSDHPLKSLELILLGETVISPRWITRLTEARCKGEVNGGIGVSTPTAYLPANPGSDSNAMNAPPLAGCPSRVAAKVRVLQQGASPAVSS